MYDETSWNRKGTHQTCFVSTLIFLYAVALSGSQTTSVKRFVVEEQDTFVVAVKQANQVTENRQSTDVFRLV